MKVNDYIIRFKKYINKSINKKDYEKALIESQVLAEILYLYNQEYTDFELEAFLIKIRKNILNENKYETNRDTILFYDGFGLDLRGWAISYIKALTSLGYRIIYVCPDVSKGKIPHIISEINFKDSIVIYLEENMNNINKIKFIDSIFREYKPSVAFFYTLPYDVNAAIAFENNKLTTRIQIDLTDHAYWIGVNTFDYIIECREMGASLAIYERNIDKKKILKLDCAPYINCDINEEQLPFDIYSTKYIFTGGALYKTLGDPNLLYYKTIDYILNKFLDIKFLYAGNGDCSEIKKIIDKYPKRAFFIKERPDFFEIIKNSIIYINSYPMFGGLMMRYAALANKIPITLKHDNDSDGILINQEKLGIEFNDYTKYIEEIDKLLLNEEYRKLKEEQIGHAVITETDFARNIKNIIENQKTEYYFENIRKLDTATFRDEYKKRFNKKEICKILGKRKNIKIMNDFFIEFCIGIIIRIKEKLVK